MLQRCAVHVTHGGCGSVHESLLAGVPMVCLPQGPIRPHGLIVVAGAPVESAESPEALRSEVRHLLEDASFSKQRSREVGAALAAYDGESALATAVEEALHQ